MDEKELKTLWEEIRKSDKDMIGLFEEVELTRQATRYKMKSNIPVYDAKREDQYTEELSDWLYKVSKYSIFVRGYRLLTEIGRSARNGFRLGDKQ